MSFTSGSDTFPSGRTGTMRLSSRFFQTWMSRMSSGPIRKAVALGSPTVVAASAGVRVVVPDSCAPGIAVNDPHTNMTVRTRRFMLQTPTDGSLAVHQWDGRYDSSGEQSSYSRERSGASLHRR